MTQLSMFPVPVARIGVAEISPDGLYRFTLERFWSDAAGDLVNFVLLNPSKADATRDDPTLRRCIGFAQSWGYGGLTITNLYSYRATDPDELWRAAQDPIGPDNDAVILRVARFAALVVCGWGNGGVIRGRGASVLRMLREAGVDSHYLAMTKLGEPTHPLYLSGKLRPRLLERQELQ